MTRSIFAGTLIFLPKSSVNSRVAAVVSAFWTAALWQAAKVKTAARENKMIKSSFVCKIKKPRLFSLRSRVNRESSKSRGFFGCLEGEKQGRKTCAINSLPERLNARRNFGKNVRAGLLTQK
jgi:hypothetical protein